MIVLCFLMNVASRFNGGDTMADLMEEYELKQTDFEEVLRWEAQLRADAA